MNNLVVAENLQINQSELEQILEFNFFDTWALEMTNVLILRQHKNKLSFIFSEFVIWFLGILFLVPIQLLIFQQWLLHGNQIRGFITVISLSAIISLGILVSFNLFLWQQAKKLKSIAIILDKIDAYNRLIQNLQVVTKFNSLSTVVTQNSDRSSLGISTALQTTKDSLLKSLELEKFILHNQQLQLQDRYQLLNSLEDNLVQFMSISNKNKQNETEYQQLLAEVIQIGLSVHREVRKNISLSS